jgi:hypothetical protein
MLTAADGRQVSDHAEMAGLLWSSYKERMGMSEGISMQFDLATILEKFLVCKKFLCLFARGNGTSN